MRQRSRAAALLTATHLFTAAALQGARPQPAYPRTVRRATPDRDDEAPRSSRGASRRAALAAAASATVTQAAPARAEIGPDQEYNLWPALPVAPYSRRKTIRRQLKDDVWVFDQIIGIYYVHVPIRMTVIRGATGLLVYAPVAPTKECLGLLQELIQQYGPVQTIILPSVAVEHKVLAGPFARKFPDALFLSLIHI